MDYKPSDVFVGVTDLFSVLLPGAIIVALGYPLIDPALLDFLGPLDGGAKAWTAFALASYLFGHLLFLAGATIDTPIYDPLRRYWIPDGTDELYDAVTKSRQGEVGSVKEINNYQWARTKLRLRSPVAIADVDRHEADSKFFRSLFVMLYAVTIFALARRWVECRDAVPQCAGATSMMVALVLVVALTVLMAIGSTVRRGKETPPEPRWYVQGLTLMVFVALGLMFEQDLVAFSTFLLSLLCLWRYGERRWKSNKLAYQYVIVMASLPPEPAGTERRS